MGQSIKAVLAVLSFVAGFFTLFSWADPLPLGDFAWIVRLVSPAALMILLWALLRLHMRQDLAPDYLKEMNPAFFNKNGFCFAFAIDGEEGICRIHAVFQNQFDGPCVGRIAIRPAKGLFHGRANIMELNFRVECGPGEFGVVSKRIPLLQKYQGKIAKFEVGANAKFPTGKGRRLRFADGIFLREGDDFSSAMGGTLKVGGVLTGHLWLGDSQTIELELPSEVEEELPMKMGQEAHSFWKWGDSPLSGPVSLSSNF